MENKFLKLHKNLCSLAVFRGVLETPIFSLFGGYCYCDEEEHFAQLDAYAAFVAEIYANGGDLTKLVQKIVFSDENVYVKAYAKGEPINPHISNSLERELAYFSEFASLTPKDFAQHLGVSPKDIPAFDSFNADMGRLYKERLLDIKKHGYGIFASNGMFRFSEEREIEPIVSADKTQLSSFVGYEEERGKVLDNTRAFIENRPAANVLLCGDAGAGKSSTVKAVANAFFEEGVRLIELRKDQLRFLPEVMGKISDNPLKFIIFIDDLSFNQNDDNFSMLKAALEGSASAMADNALIYATSNRRHIIKESFADRDGDDVHRNDTLQETLSLSERFGLTVLFSKPNKALYLKIVKELALRNGVGLEEKELEIRAEEFAIRKGNRSARCAEQFINSLL
ncbi:MAG: ATP-binding protein [Clostridia bacterium]|nr:ATP-binding protein [Clostridia bacterium]